MWLILLITSDSFGMCCPAVDKPVVESQRDGAAVISVMTFKRCGKTHGPFLSDFDVLSIDSFDFQTSR